MFRIIPSEWTGCRAQPRTPAPCAAGVDAFEDPPLRNWITRCVPTYNQRGDSCVGEGWANCLEAIVREYVGPSAIPSNRQLDGYAVYKEARRMFYEGTMKGGLMLPEGFAALKSLGWIPDDAILVEVPPDWILQGAALMTAPLVCGHSVTPGWDIWNSDNGCLDHAASRSENKGGHCTCRVGRHIQNGRRFYSALNSWGVTFGWHGIFLMDETMDDDIAISPSYTMQIPGGFERLVEHDGWRQGLVRILLQGEML